jgi:hypothetical protein
MKMLTELSASLVLSLSMTTSPTPSSMDLKASIGAWVENNSHTITPRAKVTWKHGNAKMAGYIGLWLGDLVSTEMIVGKPYRDTGLVMAEGNPLPFMNHKLGRALIIPGFGLGCAFVDRQLSIHGHSRWARAWRIVTWLIEVTSTLANLKITPWDWSIVGVMSHAGVSRLNN